MNRPTNKFCRWPWVQLIDWLTDVHNNPADDWSPMHIEQTLWDLSLVTQFYSRIPCIHFLFTAKFTRHGDIFSLTACKEISNIGMNWHSSSSSCHDAHTHASNKEDTTSITQLLILVICRKQPVSRSNPRPIRLFYNLVVSCIKCSVLK